VKANNKLNKLRFEDIWYIEAIKDYIKIHTRHGLLVTHSSMKGIEEKLPSGDFIRVHNSYIISVKAVKAVDTNSVELLNDTTLPVSKSRKDDLFSALNINEA
jgi:DNA-binding LytR/AlgR family response regulator